MKEPKELFSSYIDGYKNKTQHYDFLGEDIKNAFPLLKFDGYLNHILYNVPKDIFGESYYLVIVDNYKDYSVTVDIEEINKREIMEAASHNKFETYLKLHQEFLFEKNVLKIIPIYFSDSPLLDVRGKHDAEKDYTAWREENGIALDSYKHDAISPYSHLDYEGLIVNFESEKYKNDFEYQMSQAEECYKRKLFLPAAATLSVALETLLMAVCEKEKINLKSKDSTDTMMNYLGQRLLDEGKINYRLHKRIDVTYSLRNSVSHSNAGEVSKADCQIILSCIKLIIDEHYSK